MIKNIFFLKTDLNKIYFIEEEILFYHDYIENLKIIIKKINKQKINFYTRDLKSIQKENLENKTVSFFIKNHSFLYYPFDHNNIWSNFNFFKNYFEFGEYKYDSSIFVNIHLKFSLYEKIRGKNLLLYFLPFTINKFYYYPKNILQKLLSYLPVIKFKDKSFYKKKILFSYTFVYPKSQEFKEKYKYVFSNLSNDFSKNNYEIILNGKAEDNWNNYFNRAHKLIQYNDYIKLDKNSIILNCGVEFGFELKLFDGVKTIYNIDPSGDDYLDRGTKKIIKESETTHIFHKYALYSNEYLYGVQNKYNFKNTTLLEIIEKYKITKIDLIKSDIEGCERYMVKDLINICKKYKPQLAISIYHANHKYNDKLIDLVDIPYQLIKSLEDYDFYIEHYTYARWEIILYCIPKNI